MTTFLTCPRCSGPMEEARRRAWSAWRCERCDGFWFDAITLAYVIDPKRSLTDQRTTEALLRGLGGSPTGQRCPHCADSQLLSTELEGVPVESCPVCGGLFLDAGEARKIRAIRVRRELAEDIRRELAKDVQGTGKVLGGTAGEILLEGLLFGFLDWD